uniref:Transposase (putative) gypsy type domain-containing protein n=1 Tax=Fagus sylvatica TaxID=28930 RepID=A0A2N9F7W3_FAGSY
MGKFAKLVDTEEKIVEFKKRYGIPEDVHIRYVPYGDLALVLNQDLVLPMVAIIEGGVRIPMHTFLLQFLAHFRLAPIQCAPNVFRIVMGTAVLMEKLGLDLTVHDITYVYSLQATGRDQYTLFARNAYRKLVTGLPDSSKGRDEDFLVFTGNWQNPQINCSLRPGVPDKIFTSKKVELVERRTVEHLLQKPCFIDSGGRPRAASVLLDYVPSYKSFQKGPIVKHSRQEEVSVVRPGKDQEDIIQAVPLTARKGVQVPRLVPPLSDPNFTPSIESSEAGLPIIRFPSIFDPDPKPTEEMPVQPRTVSIADVLGTSASGTSRTSPTASPLPPPPGFLPRRRCYEERKGREERRRMMKAAFRRGRLQPNLQRPSLQRRLRVRTTELFKKPRVKFLKVVWVKTTCNNRGVALSFLRIDRSIREIRSSRAGEEFEEGKWPKRPFKVYLKLATDFWRPSVALTCLPTRSSRLKDLESSASVRIRAAESAQKSAEAGLLNLQNQVAELQRKLDAEHKSASQVRIENSQLKEALAEAEVRAEKGAQAYYDQDNAGVDDDSDLYDLAYTRQPYEDPVPEEGNELEAGEGLMIKSILLNLKKEEEGSDVDETIDVVD